MKRFFAFGVLCAVLFVLVFPAFPSVRRLPPFNLYTLRGEEIPFRPKTPSLLFFFTPECFSCLSELAKLLKDLEALGEMVLLYAVCLRCDFRDAQSVEESFGGRVTIYLAHPELPALLGIWESPAVFLVNGELRVLYQEKGTISWEVLRSSLPSEAKRRSSSREEPTTCTLGICS